MAPARPICSKLCPCSRQVAGYGARRSRPSPIRHLINRGRWRRRSRRPMDQPTSARARPMTGAAVHFARGDAISHLQALIAESLEDEAFPAARLSLTPLFDDKHEPASSPDLEFELRQVWIGSRATDRAAGRTVAGPHRVDFEVL